MNKYRPEAIVRQSSNRKTSIDFLYKVMNKDSIIESKVAICDSSLNLHIDFDTNIEGIISFDELEYNFNGEQTKEVSALSKVGRHIKFKVVDITKDEKTGKYKVTCSRKKAQEECYNNYIKTLKPGDIIEARTVHTENYGIFCDIGCGIISLLPTENISEVHILNPKKICYNNKSLYVVVKSIQDNKIILTHKELLGSWDEEVSKFNIGDKVEGTVRSIESYGYFISISQNLSGLADLKEDGNIQIGDKVLVRINSIIADKMKVKLTILKQLDSYDDTLEFEKFRYTKTEGYINYWKYSSDSFSNNRKIIETIFERN